MVTKAKSTPIERFWAKVNKDGPLFNGTPCWLWLGYIDGKGYGEFWVKTVDKRHMGAYRFAYELLVGPVPVGLEIDHLCRNHACVNPTHMEAVTHRINMLRGNTFGADEAKRTHCPRGHAYDLFNTIRDNRGQRLCRTCDTARKRISRQKEKEQPDG
ncbi:hypothetical protein LCGC14_0992970 [marine sediment metagenome]|uniref:HNH nuclease domain-containing protein n=1 Tax=marine sediment metagenome TaxID=412755 RepID=A0A0F9N9T5_9ZZZZ